MTSKEKTSNNITITYIIIHVSTPTSTQSDCKTLQILINEQGTTIHSAIQCMFYKN